MLTKETAIDQITVTENGNVSYRQVTRVLENGVSLVQTYHRTNIEPGSDLENVPEKVQAIAKAAWVYNKP
jgi:hypothetical protein